MNKYQIKEIIAITIIIIPLLLYYSLEILFNIIFETLLIPLIYICYKLDPSIFCYELIFYNNSRELIKKLKNKK